MKILVNIFKAIAFLILVVLTISYAVGDLIFTFFEHGVGNQAAIMQYDDVFTRYKDRYFP
jgi:ABC-type methionine transport system permease subunit